MKSIRQSSARIARWRGALALLVIVAAAPLWLWLNATTHVRDWLTETVSAGIGKSDRRGKVTAESYAVEGGAEETCEPDRMKQAELVCGQWTA